MKAARLPSGTLYPMLARLQDEGLVTSQWEPPPADGSGRPPRKYYQLTGEGARVARLQLAQASAAARRAAPGAARPAAGSARWPAARPPSGPPSSSSAAPAAACPPACART